MTDLLAARPPRRAASALRATPDLRLHDAVSRHDLGQIDALLNEGLRPVYLDASRRSPLDIVDAMNTDADTRLELRQALLRSRNASAPAGYAKPEALHGSPWSLEILVSGELKGGVNDAKGGSQSLEGKVFFSDRSPESDKDHFTRDNLREKARGYSRGEGLKSTTADSRGGQHRMAQALLQGLAKGRPLNLTDEQTHIACVDAAHAPRAVERHLQEILNRHEHRWPKPADLSLDEAAEKTRLPGSLVIEIEGHAPKTIAGGALVEMYRAAAAALKASLEGGKAPFLALLNEGRVVPVVLGFEKIAGLQTHVISRPITGLDGRNYAYQSANHPLAGSQAGGRLKEIEVRSLQDLATLYLGTIIKGVDIPWDVVVRIKSRGPDAGRATYLSEAQLMAFRSRLVQEGSRFERAAGERAPESSATLDSIEHLQALNAHLRSQPLDAWVPPSI